MTKVQCSVCRAVIEPGAVVCPGCGLPLVAQAVAVAQKPERKPFAPLWDRVAIAFALVSLVAYSVEHGKQQSAPDPDAAFLSDLHAGQLGTPASFQARCGQARWTHQTKEGTELHYLVNGADYYATFAAGGPRFESGRVNLTGKTPREYRIKLAEANIYSAFGCK